MMNRLVLAVLPSLMAMYLPFCSTDVRPVTAPVVPDTTLWVEPTDLETRDLYSGPWGVERAPQPHASYTLVERKHSGINPGMTVRDPAGRVWSVKQASPDALASEAQTEVVLSRVLSALGYHQPPVYYLPAFTMVDDWGSHVESAGRFRLKDRALKDRGEWSWQQNPFVGTTPYQSLLVILLTFNSSDLKNSNNTLYEHRNGDRIEWWYVVRDLGMCLGNTGRLAPRRNDVDAFERHGFIRGVSENGFVVFDYRGWHRELVRDRMTPDDVRWAAGMMSRLSDHQLHEAFRAGGYDRATAERFVRALRMRIADGRHAGSRLRAAGTPAAHEGT
jgi:hypothetical protein